MLWQSYNSLSHLKCEHGGEANAEKNALALHICMFVIYKRGSTE